MTCAARRRARRWGASAAATLIGYHVADSLTPVAKLGLVFLAPMYYLLILTGGIRPF